MIKEYSVSGMYCAGCSAAVERVVRRIPGVEAANVSLMTERLKVRCTEDLSDKITKAVEGAGYGIAPAESAVKQRTADIKRHEAEQKARRIRLIISAVFVIPLFYISMAHMVGLPPIPTADNMAIYGTVQLILLIPVMICGFGFYKRGFPSLFKLHPDMDSLIAVSTTAAFIFSLVTLIGVYKNPTAEAHFYFESVGVIMTLVMLGKYFENRAKGKTSEAIDALIAIAPDTANIVDKDGNEHAVKIDEVITGEHIKVRAGEAFPTDGVIISGSTAADESMLTGESMPVNKDEGDTVACGTVNLSGVVIIEATNVGEDTALASIIRMVDEAQGSKAPVQGLADKICGIFVPTVIGIAVVTLIIQLLVTKDIASALRAFTAVLVIACPCALGLATPTAIMVATGRGATMGILIRNGEALENACHINAIAFDKTGTLTEGKPKVTDVIVKSDNMTENEFIKLFASVERDSEHPLGKCIVEHAHELGIELYNSSNFESLSGRGAKVSVEGTSYIAGNARLMTENGLNDIPDLAYLNEQGKTVMYLSDCKEIIGSIAVADTPKSDAKDTIAALKESGIIPVMLSGDNETTVKAVADSLGIEHYMGGVLPDKKAQTVTELQKQYGSVAMVGDGINDAAAISTANVGLAIGTGTDVAMAAADIVIMGDSLFNVSKAIKLSRATMRIIKQNLFWAFAYNCIGIPIAAIGALNPMIAALAMCFSSITVLTNALRLKRVKK